VVKIGIWIWQKSYETEPAIEVARPGRTLKRHALGQALKVILDTFALGKWTIIACLTHVNMRK
jgi:hypothetical protein